MVFRRVGGFASTPTDRIAVVSHSHPSISKGGAEIAAYTLFQGLRAKGRDAIFVGCCPAGGRDRIELGENEHAIFFEGDTYDHFYHLASEAVAAQLHEILQQERATLVNFHHYFNLGIGALRDVAAHLKTVVTLHEFLAICHHHGQMITRPAHLLCDRSLPRACATCFPEHSRQQFALRRRSFLDSFAEVDAFVSPSYFLAERYVQWGLLEHRMHVIENGLAKLPPPGAVKAHDDNRLWSIGFFGQINPFKGLDVVLGACALIAKRTDLKQRIRLRIHGNVIGQSAEFIKRFEDAVAKYEFLSYQGPYDNAQVGRLMSACDYVLVPSGWWENSPVVIQEAYASRRPVICTGIGGMAEKVVAGVTGLHFELNDPADLTAAISKAASAETFDRLSAGLPPVMDSGAMADRYLELFTNLPARRTG